MAHLKHLWMRSVMPHLRCAKFFFNLDSRVSPASSWVCHSWRSVMVISMIVAEGGIAVVVRVLHIFRPLRMLRVKSKRLLWVSVSHGLPGRLDCREKAVSEGEVHKTQESTIMVS